MKSFLFTVLFLICFSAKAFFERKLSAAALYNPVGFGVSVAMAYNYKLWGESENKNWLYGYIRPKAQLDISGLINGATAEIQVFPISIFGLSLGTQTIDRHIKKTAYFSCDDVNCEGQLKRDYIRGNLALKYSQVVSLLQYQRDHYQIEDDKQVYLDYSSLMLLKNDQTELEKYIAFIGYELNDKLTVGFLEFYQKLSDKKAEAQFISAIYKEGDKKWMAGIGTSGSDYTEKYIALFLRLNWILDPTLSLVD